MVNVVHTTEFDKQKSYIMKGKTNECRCEHTPSFVLLLLYRVFFVVVFILYHHACKNTNTQNKIKHAKLEKGG